MSAFDVFDAPNNLQLVEITLFDVIFSIFVHEVQISYVPGQKCLHRMGLKNRVANLCKDMADVEAIAPKIAENAQEKLAADWIKVVVRRNPHADDGMIEATSVLQQKQPLPLSLGANDG